MESVLDTSSQCYGLYPVTPSLSQMWKLSPRMVHNYAQTASPQSLRFMICLGSKARPSDDGLNTFHPHDETFHKGSFQVRDLVLGWEQLTWQVGVPVDGDAATQQGTKKLLRSSDPQ